MKKLIVMTFLIVAVMVHFSFAQSTIYKSAITGSGIRQQVAITLETVSDGGIVVHKSIDLQPDNTDATFYNNSGLGSNGTDPNTGQPTFAIPSTGTTVWYVPFESGAPVKLVPGSTYTQDASGILVSAPNVKEIGIIGDFFGYSATDAHPIKLTISTTSSGVVNVQRSFYNTLTTSSNTEKHRKIYNASGLAATQQTDGSYLIHIPDDNYWIVPDATSSAIRIGGGTDIGLNCSCMGLLVTSGMYPTPNTSCGSIFGGASAFGCPTDCDNGMCTPGMSMSGVSFIGGGVLVHATNVRSVDASGHRITPNPYDFVGQLHNEGLDYIRSRKSEINMSSVSTALSSAIPIITDYLIQKVAANPPAGYDETAVRAEIADYLNSKLDFFASVVNGDEVSYGDMFSSDQLNFISRINNALAPPTESLIGVSISTYFNSANEQIMNIENDINSSSLNEDEKKALNVYSAVARNSANYWYQSDHHPSAAGIDWGGVGKADAEGAVAGALSGVKTVITNPEIVAGGPATVAGTIVVEAVGGALLGSAIDGLFQAFGW